MPKFIFLLHASTESESGAAPSKEIIEAMTDYNTLLSENDLLLGGEGLKDSSFGARLTYPSEKSAEVAVQMGPFSLGGLLCGFWLIRAKSLSEAIEWAKKAPLQGGSLEVRQIGGDEDMGEGFTDELKAREEVLRQQVEARLQEK